jgi:hypothetical protein
VVDRRSTVAVDLRGAIEDDLRGLACHHGTIADVAACRAGELVVK